MLNLPDNDDRADWAQKALAAFAAETNQSIDHETEEIVTDFLCDLMHFCIRKEINFDNCLENGTEHFRYESSPDYEGD